MVLALNFIAAFVNDANQIVTAKYYSINQMYPGKVRKPTVATSSDAWQFEIYDWAISNWRVFYRIGLYEEFRGITGNMKCVTYGAWARNTTLNLGLTQIQYPIYRSTVTGNTYNYVPLDTPNHHASVNDIYYQVTAAGAPFDLVQVTDQ